VNEPRMLQVRRNILKGNDMVARRLRDRFRHAGVVVISLLSSPGSGKTTLLERVLSDFGQEYRVAALVGDLATENDATRLAQAGCQSSRSTPVLCAISTPV
jgi:hydrogenase nickel incorporation protein HypB